MFGKRKQPYNVDNMVPVTADVGVLNDSFTHANVAFPTPWTLRVQTPVRRVKHGNMWGSEVY